MIFANIRIILFRFSYPGTWRLADYSDMVITWNRRSK